MPPGAERGGGEGVMRLGRGGDDQRVAGGEQRVEAQRGRARLPADGLGPLLVRVMDPGQHGPLGAAATLSA